MEDPQLLERAKERCKDCFALVETQNGRLICDETNIPIEEITQCQEWVNPNDGQI